MVPDQAKRLNAVSVSSSRTTTINPAPKQVTNTVAATGARDFAEIFTKPRLAKAPRFIANNSREAATVVARQQPTAEIAVPSVTRPPITGATYSWPRSPNSDAEPANALTPAASVPNPSISTAVPKM